MSAIAHASNRFPPSSSFGGGLGGELGGGDGGCGGGEGGSGGEIGDGGGTLGGGGGGGKGSGDVGGGGGGGNGGGSAGGGGGNGGGDGGGGKGGGGGSGASITKCWMVTPSPPSWKVIPWIPSDGPNGSKKPAWASASSTLSGMCLKVDRISTYIAFIVGVTVIWI
jgi:hypothetical protein